MGARPDQTDEKQAQAGRPTPVDPFDLDQGPVSMPSKPATDRPEPGSEGVEAVAYPPTSTIELDDWVVLDDGTWIDLDTGLVHDLPGNPPLHPEPHGPIAVSPASSLAADFVALDGTPHTEIGGDDDGRARPGPADGTYYDHTTGTYHQDDPDGPIVGYHTTIADQMSPPIDGLGIYDNANGTWITPDGQRTDTDPYVPFADLPPDTQHQILANAGLDHITQPDGGTNLHQPGPGTPQSAEAHNLFTNEDLDTWHYDPTTNQIYPTHPESTGDPDNPTDPPAPIELDDWVVLDDGTWIDLDTGLVHDLPGNPPLHPEPHGPIAVSPASSLAADFVALDGTPHTEIGGDDDGRARPGPADGTYYDHTTGTYHQDDPDGPIVGYHTTIADQMSPPIDGLGIYDNANGTWITPDGQRTDTDPYVPFADLPPDTQHQILANAGLDHITQPDGGTNLHQPGPGTPQSAEAHNLFTNEDLDTWHYDPTTNQIYPTHPESTGDPDNPTDPPAPIELDDWVVLDDGTWIDLDTGLVHDLPGNPPLHPEPHGPIAVSPASSLAADFVALDGTPHTEIGGDDDGRARPGPADGTYYDHTTGTYHQDDPDGPIVGYHTTIADQMSPPIDGLGIYDNANGTWITPDGQRTDTDPYVPFADLPPDTQHQILANAGLDHITQPDGGTNLHQPGPGTPQSAEAHNLFTNEDLDTWHYDPTTGTLHAWDPALVELEDGNWVDPATGEMYHHPLDGEIIGTMDREQLDTLVDPDRGDDRPPPPVERPDGAETGPDTTDIATTDTDGKDSADEDAASGRVDGTGTDSKDLGGAESDAARDETSTDAADRGEVLGATEPDPSAPADPDRLDDLTSASAAQVEAASRSADPPATEPDLALGGHDPLTEGGPTGPDRHADDPDGARFGAGHDEPTGPVSDPAVESPVGPTAFGQGRDDHDAAPSGAHDPGAGAGPDDTPAPGPMAPDPLVAAPTDPADSTDPTVDDAIAPVDEPGPPDPAWDDAGAVDDDHHADLDGPG